MSGYRQGRDVEWAVIADLKENGYQTTRAASSKGVSDVIAIKKGQVLLVNVKHTTPPGPAERVALLEVAAMIPTVAIPLVAIKAARQPIAYRRLTGPGPYDWQQWSPDFAVSADFVFVRVRRRRPPEHLSASHSREPDL